MWRAKNEKRRSPLFHMLLHNFTLPLAKSHKMNAQGKRLCFRTQNDGSVSIFFKGSKKTVTLPLSDLLDPAEIQAGDINDAGGIRRKRLRDEITMSTPTTSGGISLVPLSLLEQSNPRLSVFSVNITRPEDSAPNILACDAPSVPSPIPQETPPAISSPNPQLNPHKPQNVKRERSIFYRLFALNLLVNSVLPTEKPPMLTPLEWEQLSVFRESFGSYAIVSMTPSGEVNIEMPSAYDSIIHSRVNYGEFLHERPSDKTRFRWWSDSTVYGFSSFRSTKTVLLGMACIKRSFFVHPRLSSDPVFMSIVNEAQHTCCYTTLLSALSFWFSRIVFHFTGDQLSHSSEIYSSKSRAKFANVRTINVAVELALDDLTAFIRNEYHSDSISEVFADNSDEKHGE